jgi:Flp pilus assembly protein TadB
MYTIMSLVLSGLGITALIFGLLVWNYERKRKKAAQERAENREAARRIEAGRKLNEESHGDGFEYRD